MRKLGNVKPRNYLAGRGKLQQGKTDGLVMNKKKDRFATATAISKRANTNLGIKTSRHTISRRFSEINLNSQVASTKPYISKKNKMSRLKFATRHVIRTENSRIAFLSAISQSLACSVVTGEGSFDAVLRNDIRLSAQKNSVRLGGGSVMLFGMIAAGTRPFFRLHDKINATLYKEKLKKHAVSNLRTAINQLAVFQQYNALCLTVKSVKTFLS